ncbi:helix-turn-helix domain-containing protein [Cohnella terricola]|uniref:Helix-turn-helix transcriptional regulator n=1 Tax=Cohnella terricola TaxID=1289167 RepID=A0A559JWB2_9BACL|nr:helix-turn-helix domain-containing protein [Cohnella terricola]TVY04173.1 helix-turn-helix transcriptional regulator [Cohnella terricola]
MKIVSGRTFLRFPPILSLIMMMLIAFAFFLSHEYSKRAAADVNMFALAKIKHSYHNTQFTFDTIRSFGISSSQENAINEWLITDRSNPVMDAEAFKASTRLANQQPFLHSIYLINTKTRRVIDSSTGIADFGSFYDQNIVDKILRDHPAYIGFFPHAIGETSYISLVVPSTQAVTLHAGYLVIILNQKELQKFLLQNEDTAGLQISITDKHNQIILGDDLPDQMSVTSSDKLLESLQSLEYSSAKEPQIVSVELLPGQLFMHFIVIEKEMIRNIEWFKKKIAISCIVLMGVMLLLYFWNSKRTLGPFRMLSRELQSKLGNEDIGKSMGEADIIRNSFMYLLNSNQTMKHSLKDYHNIVREEFLRQWVLQGYPIIRNDIEQSSQLLSLDSYYLSVIRIESYKQFVETYNYNSRKLLKYAMCNIGDEVVKEAQFLCEIVDMGGDHLVLLIGASETGGEQHEISTVLLLLGAQIERWLHIRTSIACSSKLRIQENVRRDYEDTYELTLLKFFKGENKVYTAQDLEESYSSEHKHPDEKIMNELIHAIKQIDRNQVLQLLDRLLNDLKNVTYNEFFFQLQMIAYRIFKSFNKVTLSSELDSSRFSSLVEARRWIEDEILQIMDTLDQQQISGRKGELFQETLDYVQQHLQDPSMSVDTIADHLGYSTSHLRYVFKEASQVTLADYILLERIEQVKYLLTNTDDNLTVIAAKTGFQTRSHFFSAFKKATGLTPSQFRKTN